MLPIRLCAKDRTCLEPSPTVSSMPICAGVNFTDRDLYYYGKMQHEKSWAWWLNNLGRTTSRAPQVLMRRLL